MDMKRNLLYAGAILLGGLLAACNEDSAGDGPGDSPGFSDDVEMIRLFSSGIESAAERTKADEEPFPNSGAIGVLATYYKSDPGWQPDWTLYPDIDNAAAAAQKVPNTEYKYTFNFNPVKYWPFNGAQLVFGAYSPRMGLQASGDKLYLSPDRETMHITIHTGMPDVLYASNNYSLQPYDKGATGVTPPPVDLGEFRHALSKLTVQVKRDDVMDPEVRLMYLSVSTTKTKATMKLFEDENNQPVPGADEAGEFILFNANGNYNSGLGFYNSPVERFQYLLPETGTVTKVRIKLRGKHADNTAEQIVTLSDVEDGNSDPLELMKGLNTILTVTVRSTDIIKPDDDITLQGALAGWYEAGDFDVVIQ